MTGGSLPDEPRALVRWLPRACALVIVLAGALTYANSLQGVFVLDDLPTIVSNAQLTPDPGRSVGEAIRNLVLGLPNAPNAGRPVVSVTLWLNHLLAQKEPLGYHVFNVVVHVLVALALFGCLRRTLQLREPLQPLALPVAFSAALIWTVHPLNSSAVTYISQRAEALMAMFFVFSFYCIARGFEAEPRRRQWYAAAVLSCVLCEMSKEVGAMLPILAVLFDRAFLAGSWRGVLRHRRSLHLALFATWAITIALLCSDPRPDSAGWTAEGRGIDSWTYATAQCAAILMYLRLVFWPQPLVLDYGWPIPAGFSEYAIPGVALAAIALVCVWAVFARPRWGFLGAWFFIILGPSSSFLPIVTEIVAEHRMYLSSAAVITAAVTAACLVGNRALLLWPHHRPLLVTLACALLVVITVAGSWATARQNALYHSGIALWERNVRLTPDNPRALINLGEAYERAGRSREALAVYRAATRYSEAHTIPFYPMIESAVDDALRLAFRLNDVDAVREQLGRMDKLLDTLDQSSHFHARLAETLRRVGREDDAIAAYERAIATLDEPRARLHFHLLLGDLLAQARTLDAALAVYERALLLESEMPDARSSLRTVRTRIAGVLILQQRMEDAAQTVARAIGEPLSSPLVFAEMARVARLVDAPEAAQGFADTAQLQVARARLSQRIADGEDSADTHERLGQVLVKLGEMGAAEEQYELAKKADPTGDRVYQVWGFFLYKLDRRDEAMAHFRKAIELRPTNSLAHSSLGIMLLEDSDYAAAVASLEKALELDPDQPLAREKLAEARAAAAM